MNSKTFIVALVIILFIFAVFFFGFNREDYKENTQNDSKNVNRDLNNVLESNSSGGKISLNDLSKHNSLSDCWIAYKGKVYDITTFLPKHPGSAQAILSYCGSATEFENAFIKKHGETKVNMLMKVGVFIGDFDVVGKLN